MSECEFLFLIPVLPLNQTVREVPKVAERRGQGRQSRLHAVTRACALCTASGGLLVFPVLSVCFVCRVGGSPALLTAGRRAKRCGGPTHTTLFTHAFRPSGA